MVPSFPFSIFLALLAMASLADGYAMMPGNRMSAVATMTPPSARPSRTRPSSSSARLFVTAEAEDADEAPRRRRGLRRDLRRATGFSLAAFRAARRAATGLSLAAVYAGCLAASGAWMRKLMSAVLSPWPAGFRYFLQPLLIAYYAPLFLLRGLTAPDRRRRHRANVADGWNDALRYAEEVRTSGYEPIRRKDDGTYEAVKPPSPDHHNNHRHQPNTNDDPSRIRGIVVDTDDEDDFIEVDELRP